MTQFKPSSSSTSRACRRSTSRACRPGRRRSRACRPVLPSRLARSLTQEGLTRHSGGRCGYAAFCMKLYEESTSFLLLFHILPLSALSEETKSCHGSSAATRAPVSIPPRRPLPQFFPPARPSEAVTLRSFHQPSLPRHGYHQSRINVWERVRWLRRPETREFSPPGLRRRLTMRAFSPTFRRHAS